MLKYVGAQDDRFKVKLKVRSGAATELVEIGNRELSGAMVQWDYQRAPDTPLYLTNLDQNYWFKPLDDVDAIYVGYNRCMMQASPTFDAFVKSLFAAIDEQNGCRVIIDLRHNGGGSSPILGPVINGLADRAEVDTIGLIGTDTFSSAILNALDLRRRAGAVLVGGPTGGKPNHFGEIRWFHLPNSQLRVFYSTKYFRMINDDDLPSIQPDHTVIPSSNQYFSGQDPVLEFALGDRVLSK